MRENLLVVTGNPETKELKDLMPEILKQVGVQQYNYLKNIIGNMDTVKESKIGEEDEDDVPDLVGTNFEEASKKWSSWKQSANRHKQPRVATAFLKQNWGKCQPFKDNLFISLKI